MAFQSFAGGLGQGFSGGIELGMKRQALQDKRAETQRASAAAKQKQLYERNVKAMGEVKKIVDHYRIKNQELPKEITTFIETLVGQINSAQAGLGTAMWQAIDSAPTAEEMAVSTAMSEQAGQRAAMSDAGLPLTQQNRTLYPDAYSTPEAVGFYDTSTKKVITVVDQDQIAALDENPNFTRLSSPPTASYFDEKTPTAPSYYDVYDKDNNIVGQVNIKDPDHYQKASQMAGGGQVFLRKGEVTGDASSFGAAEQKGNYKAYQAILAEGKKALETQEQLKLARRLVQSDDLYQGFGAEQINDLKRLSSALGFTWEGADLAAGLTSIANQLALNKTEQLSGQISDRDLAVIQAIGPEITKTAEGNRFVIDIMAGLAERQIYGAKLARQLRSDNQFFVEGDWFDEMSRKDFLSNIRMPSTIITLDEFSAESGFSVEQLEATMAYEGMDLPEVVRKWRGMQKK